MIYFFAAIGFFVWLWAWFVAGYGFASWLDSGKLRADPRYVGSMDVVWGRV